MIIFSMIGSYLAIGFVVALMFPADRVLGRRVDVTCGARLLLVPGGMVLWPWIAARWFRGGRL